MDREMMHIEDKRGMAVREGTSWSRNSQAASSWGRAEELKGRGKWANVSPEVDSVQYVSCCCFQLVPFVIKDSSSARSEFVWPPSRSLYLPDLALNLDSGKSSFLQWIRWAPRRAHILAASRRLYLKALVIFLWGQPPISSLPGSESTSWP